MVSSFQCPLILEALSIPSELPFTLLTYFFLSCIASIATCRPSPKTSFPLTCTFLGSTGSYPPVLDFSLVLVFPPLRPPKRSSPPPPPHACRVPSTSQYCHSTESHNFSPLPNRLMRSLRLPCDNFSFRFLFASL